MPAWLRVVASVNPLSYQVDALRTLMLAGGAITWGIGLDIGVLLVVATALIVIGARVYPQLVQ
jgi:ABC-2 type transport system permease protein